MTSTHVMLERGEVQRYCAVGGAGGGAGGGVGGGLGGGGLGGGRGGGEGGGGEGGGQDGTAGWGRGRALLGPRAWLQVAAPLPRAQQQRCPPAPGGSTPQQQRGHPRGR